MTLRRIRYVLVTVVVMCYGCVVLRLDFKENKVKIIRYCRYYPNSVVIKVGL